jgi:hypothetical protein
MLRIADEYDKLAKHAGTGEASRMSKVQMRADSCRAHALKCRAEAAVVQHEPLRNQFLDLAQTWESMAQQIEELEALSRKLKRELEQPNAEPPYQAPLLERRM